jgi:myotubularin-related protein 1/2
MQTTRLRNSVINTDFRVSSTYPDVLVIPTAITDEELRKICEFRSMGRFPALCWMHPSNSSVMLRCSQPNSGIIGYHCVEDEKLFNLLNVKYIFDARPKINAVANQMKGKG